MSIDAASYALIFGGCCSNVFALEGIVKKEADSGLLITTTQLLTTALLTLPTQLTRNHSILPTLKSPSLPLRSLLTSSLLFVLVNALNNWAFAFQISVPLHIILRSFGSVMTMLVGFATGKRYTKVQVAGVLGLTVGVVIAAWADARGKGAEMSMGPRDEGSRYSFTAGLVVLFVAQLLGAWMGVYTEQTYARHGRHWRENLFYTHFIGSILSLALLPTLYRQFQRLLLGPKLSLPASLTSTLISTLPKRYHSLTLDKDYLPSHALALLIVNALTQYLCISGVNRLSATTSAVTVTVVLNVRKLVSFVASCVIFGNRMSPLMVLGAGIVFASGAVYGIGGAWSKKKAVGGTESRAVSDAKKRVEGWKESEGEKIAGFPNGTGEFGVEKKQRITLNGSRSPSREHGSSPGPKVFPDGTMMRR